MNRESADSVYRFLASSDPVAPATREAVQVIENAIDEFGYVKGFACYGLCLRLNSSFSLQTRKPGY